MTPQQELAQHYLGAEALNYHLVAIACQYDMEPSSGMEALDRERQILRSRIAATAKDMDAPWPATEDDDADLQVGVSEVRYLLVGVCAAWAAVFLTWRFWA